MGIMDLGQQRTRKVVNDLEHLLYKERLIELGVFILEKKMLWRIFYMCINTQWEGMKKRQPE